MKYLFTSLQMNSDFVNVTVVSLGKKP